MLSDKQLSQIAIYMEPQIIIYGCAIDLRGLKSIAMYCVRKDTFVMVHYDQHNGQVYQREFDDRACLKALREAGATTRVKLPRFSMTEKPAIAVIHENSEPQAFLLADDAIAAHMKKLDEYSDGYALDVVWHAVKEFERRALSRNLIGNGASDRASDRYEGDVTPSLVGGFRERVIKRSEKIPGDPMKLAAAAMGQRRQPKGPKR